MTPQAMAPSHQGTKITSPIFISMTDSDRFKEEQYAAHPPVTDPLNVLPLTVTVLRDPR